MPTDNVVVSCRAINRTFFSENRVNQVLRDISLSVKEGDFVVLIGPSGCGKSTLLNLIAGFDKPTSGQVSVGGVPVTKPGPDKSMVFQDYALLPWLNARENVEIGLRLQKVEKRERRRVAEEFLHLVGLAEAVERPVYKLSGGMQQRVSIARALALKPKVLLMDEPFGALDAFQRAIMHRELSRIWSVTNVTIIFVTHSLEEALILGRRVLAMTPGAVGFTGDLEIDLPRPRDPMSTEFTALKRKLYDMLTIGTSRRVEAFAD
jgi:ABC-type nitrate/sulfonate/bicarbonate transport system ATPase subunit